MFGSRVPWGPPRLQWDALGYPAIHKIPTILSAFPHAAAPNARSVGAFPPPDSGVPSLDPVRPRVRPIPTRTARILRKSGGVVRLLGCGNKPSNSRAKRHRVADSLPLRHDPSRNSNSHTGSSLAPPCGFSRRDNPETIALRKRPVNSAAGANCYRDLRPNLQSSESRHGSWVIGHSCSALVRSSYGPWTSKSAGGGRMTNDE